MCSSLRPVDSSDEPFLFELYASTRAEELDEWGWDAQQRQLFLDQQFRAQQRSYEVQFPEVDHRIVTKNGHTIGRIMVHRAVDGFRLIDIALLPAYRNGGVGTHLVQALLDEAAAAGQPVRLHVLRTSPAIRLYRRLGFAVVGDDGMYLEMMARASRGEDG